MKKGLILLMMICALFGAQTVTFADTGVLIEVNGDAVDLNENTGLPFVDQASRTQIPVKAVLEALGISVGWDGQERQVIAEKEGTQCLIPIGKPFIVVNGQTLSIDTSAVIKNNRTYIPIKQVAEQFGYQVSWDGYKRGVYIYDDSHKAYYDALLSQSAELAAAEKQAKINAELNAEAWAINKQGNLIIENKDYIFFAMYRTDGTTRSDMYKLSKKTGKMTHMKNAGTSGGMFASDRYIINLDPNFYNIERIDIQTGEKTILVSNADTRPLGDQCLLIGDWFYFSDLKKRHATGPYEVTYYDAFRRVNINTGEIEVLGDYLPENMRYYNGQLIYTIESPDEHPNHDFYVVDLETLKEIKTIKNDGYASLPKTIVDNRMYLQDGADGPTLYWTDLNDDVYREQTLDNQLDNPCVNTDELMVYGDYAYMLGDDAFADMYHIYKQNLETGDYKDIIMPLEYHTSTMNIIDDKIYIYSTENVNFHLVSGHIYSMDLDGNHLKEIKSN